MADQVTEVVHTGWLNRIGKSIVGILFGLLLFVASFALLYWNDGRVDISSVAEKSVPLDPAAVTTDSGMQGQMISVTGEMKAGASLGDGEYLSPGDYLAYERDVEMYAWVEETHSESDTEVGGGETTRTTYTYRLEWTNDPEDSSSFKERFDHENPKMTIEKKSGQASDVGVGPYKVDMNGIQLRGWERLLLSPELVGRVIQGGVVGRQDKAVVAVNPHMDTDGDGLTDIMEKEGGTDYLVADTDGDGLDDGMESMVYMTDPKLADTDGDTYSDGSEISGGYNPLGEGDLAEETIGGFSELSKNLEESKIDLSKQSVAFEEDRLAKEKAAEEERRMNELDVSGYYAYVGQGSPTSPHLGDQRISYRVIRANQAGTVFGKLTGDAISSFSDKDGNKVHYLSAGSRESALENMHQEYVTTLWLLRIVGLFMMWFGLTLVLSPISVFLDFIPVFGKVSRWAAGFLALAVSLVLSAVTVVVSRLLHSPIAIILSLAIGVATVVLMVRTMKKKGSTGESVADNRTV